MQSICLRWSEGAVFSAVVVPVRGWVVCVVEEVLCEPIRIELRIREITGPKQWHLASHSTFATLKLNLMLAL